MMWTSIGINTKDKSAADLLDAGKKTWCGSNTGIERIAACLRNQFYDKADKTNYMPGAERMDINPNYDQWTN